MLLVYLGLTILLELPIFLLFWRKEGWLQATLFCVLVNGLTNPLLNLALLHWDWNVYLLEMAVVGVEGLAAKVVWKADWSRAFLFSFAANGFSYLAGVALQALGWL